MAHGQGKVGQAIAETVLAAVVGLDAERVRLYVDLALSSLNEVARNALEALMRSGNYEYQSEFARKYVALGREEGRQKGHEEGREEGRQEGEKAALLEVLDARGLVVDAVARQRILSCTELSQLKRWLRRVVTVQSVKELFEGEPVSTPAARKTSKPRRTLKAGKPPSKRR